MLRRPIETTRFSMHYQFAAAALTSARTGSEAYNCPTMNHLAIQRPILFAFWTILALASAFPILADCLGTAAWNGVNLAVAFYLVLSIGGFLGLLAGFIAAFSHKRLFAWITCASAVGIVALSIVFASGFLCCRTPGVPLTDPMYFGRLHLPILALDGAAGVVCSVEALLAIAKIRMPRLS